MTELTCGCEADSIQANTGGPTDLTDRSGPSSARWHLPSHLRLWPIAIMGLAIDLWTKHWAFTTLNPVEGKGKVIIPHLMTFCRSLNEGALFGLGKGWTPLFILASFLALGFVLYLFVHSQRNQRSLHIGLALVLAGALGNLYDRSFMIADIVVCNQQGKQTSEVCKVVKHDERGLVINYWPNDGPPRFISKSLHPRVHSQGVVRDFIHMKPRITIGEKSFEIWPWVFNIADVLLVAGVGLLLLNFWWERKAGKKARPQAQMEVTT
ncbi:MAG: signal peptidase II [Planctomycetota bacterium]|jgi:lipoprotein signal peptidase